MEIGGTVIMGADVEHADPMRSAYLTLTLEEEGEMLTAAYRMLRLHRLVADRSPRELRKASILLEKHRRSWWKSLRTSPDGLRSGDRELVKQFFLRSGAAPDFVVVGHAR